MARFVLLAVALTFGLVGGMSVAPADPPDRAEAVGPITLQQVATGLTQPVGIAHAGDGRLFIVERGGLIRIYNGAGIVSTPFLNVSALLSTAGQEEGLLGLAFHPDYPGTPYFFVHYTNTSGDVVIARYTVSANPNIADPASARILRTISHPTENNHNGGQLAFGQDGYLYVAIGDGGSFGDPGNNAQNINTYLGKILRIDVDQNVGVPPYYGIPPSNPFAGATPGLDEIWAFGLRNPWRFSFDRTTGDLFIADVGQGNREEIDVEPDTSPGGVNYGWRIMEGFACYINEGVGCFHASLTPPVLDYDHSAGDCSVTGGYMYRGMSPGFVGNYIYADFCSGRIWSTAPGGPPWPSTPLLDSSFLISSFGEDVNGELYLADYGGGTLQRLLLEDQDGDGLADQADNCPLAVNPLQENSDRNFVDNSPPYSSGVDDMTWPNSDYPGDACDADNDNDGASDTNEAAGAACAGHVTSGIIRDTDGDRFLDGAECFLGTDPTSAASRPLLTNCGPSGDSDDDGIANRVEFCFYNTNSSVVDSDSDGLLAGAADGCEVASVNGDRIVSSIDQGMLASGISGSVTYHANVDINKDGVLNSIDQGMMASFIVPAGQCP